MIHATSWMHLKIVLMRKESNTKSIHMYDSVSKILRNYKNHSIMTKKRDHSCSRDRQMGGWTEKEQQLKVMGMNAY